MKYCRFSNEVGGNSSDSQLAYKYADDLCISALIKGVDPLPSEID